MKARRVSLIAVAILCSLVLLMAPASEANTLAQINAIPETIIVGETTCICITTSEGPASGWIYVIGPTGDKWRNEVSIGSAGGTQSWDFPDETWEWVEGPGSQVDANTDTLGSYQVEAYLDIGIYEDLFFAVPFFVIPFGPLGALGIIGSCFAGLGAFRLYRKK